MEDGDGNGNAKPCFGALVLAPGATPSPDLFLLESSGDVHDHKRRPRKRLGLVQSIARFVSEQLGNANRYVDPVLLVPGERGGSRLQYSEVFQRKRCLSRNAAAPPVLELDLLGKYTSWSKFQAAEKACKVERVDRDGAVPDSKLGNEDQDQEKPSSSSSSTSAQVQRSPSSSEVQSLPSTSQIQSLPSPSQVQTLPSSLHVQSLPSSSFRVQTLPQSLPAATKSTTARLAEETVAEEKRKTAQRGKNHAVAGALAGVFVSLCLHPLDTVKTVIQSKNTGKHSIFPIVGSIVSSRGVTGLYRGFGSNLASSAPISAIYAFTYETMKAALLPRLPEKYHSLAHCAAGGCASIATSLVYTPSERVKQQMQIGTVYRNSWLAFVGIIQRGGVPALYAGWEAVLCRNVPQSVIKFFTYEALKHRALRDSPNDTHLTNLQTLAFGGLAGSTAALFTTPFDVVKTRLQTQTIGSQHQYSSVLNALRIITRDEGIRSLYRGLIPRLAIYVSQGALFFASYEFFKRALTTESRENEKSRADASSVSREESEQSSSSGRRRALLT